MDSEIIDMLKSVGDIRSKMVDDTSRMIYDLRIRSFLHGDEGIFLDAAPALSDDWRIEDLDRLLSFIGKSDCIILCGAGKQGKRTYDLLMHSKYRDMKIIFFDNNPFVREHLKERGLFAVDAHDVMDRFTGGVAIISSYAHRCELYDQLISGGFPSQRILMPQDGILIGKCGEQYFDCVPSDRRDEVFVDAGCYNGNTSLAFMGWAGGWSKIYAFEANPHAVERCRKIFDELNMSGRVQLIPKGTWKECGHVSFRGAI